MNKVKKILLILTICVVSIVMLFTLKSFAAEEEDYSITVYGDVANKEFYLIKLFSLSVDGDNYLYSWDETTTYAREYFTNLGYDTAEKAADYLTDFSYDQNELIQLISPMFDPDKARDRKVGGAGDTAVDFTGLEQGYYVVFDNTILPDTPRSCAMLKSLRNDYNPVYLKSQQMTITKEISKPSIENGEETTVRVHIKCPNVTGYDRDNYVFKLTEGLSEGLEYKADSLVTSWDLTYDTEPFTCPNSYNPDTRTLTVDIGGYAAESGGCDIIVEYVVRRKNIDEYFDNTSTSTLEFSADPMNPSQKRRIENVIVHTYTIRVQFTKRNVFGEGLHYAKFKLRMPDGKWAILDNNGVLQGKTENEIDATPIYAPNFGTFYISGLRADEGYSLKELETYQGYSVPNFTFDFDLILGVDNSGIVTFSKYDFKTDESNPFAVGFSSDVTADYSTDIPGVDLINVKAYELPSTGGIGTRVLKIVGFTLMSTAALIVIFIVIKKNRKEE